MFEQSFVAGRGRTAKRWTVILSAAGQSVVIGVLILIPLVFTEPLAMPKFDFAAHQRLRPHAVAIAEVRHEARASVDHPVYRRAVLFSPTIIRPVNLIVDEPEPALRSAAAGSPDGIVGLPVELGSSSQFSPAPPAPAPRPEPVAAPPPKPEVRPAVREPIRVSIGVQQAKAIRQPKPVYPELAKRMRVQGRVLLMCVIARDGTIQQLRVVSGHPMLVEAAAGAVRQWIYSPTLLNGEPVEVIAPIEVNFTMQQ